MKKKHTIIAAAVILIAAISVLSWQQRTEDEDLRVLDVHAGRTTYDTRVPFGTIPSPTKSKLESYFVSECFKEAKKQFGDLELFERLIEVRGAKVKAQFALCAIYPGAGPDSDSKGFSRRFELIELTHVEQSVLKLGLAAANLENLMGDPNSSPMKVCTLEANFDDRMLLIPLVFAEGEMFVTYLPSGFCGTELFNFAEELGYDPAALQMGVDVQSRLS